MDSLIFELQIIFYFQSFLSANVRHRLAEWDKHWSAERQPVGSNPGRTNTQDF